MGKTFKPPLRKDAIARAYQRSAADAWPHGPVDAQVLEDSVHGLKVQLSVIATEDNDLEQVREMFTPALEKLAYTWEVTHVRL